MYTPQRRKALIHKKPGRSATDSGLIASMDHATDSNRPSSQPGLARDSSAVQVRTPVRPMPTHFLSLPAEIRNRIYEFVLLEDKPFGICSGVGQYNLGGKRQEGRVFIGFGLFHVSRQIHEEATAIFYGRNGFQFTSPFSSDSSNLASMLFNMGRNAALIRIIRIWFPWVSCHQKAADMFCTMERHCEILLSILQDRCVNVRALKLLLNPRILQHHSYHGTRDIPAALALAEILGFCDARFHKFVHLNEITIVAHKTVVDDDARRAIADRVWDVKLLEYSECW